MRRRYAAAHSAWNSPLPARVDAEPVELQCELGLLSIRLAKANYADSESHSKVRDTQPDSSQTHRTAIGDYTLGCPPRSQ